MLGGFRLALATVVVLSHCGFALFGIGIGVSAVAAFYMVSGYAMSAMWRRWYAERNDVTGFYVDRVLRLYPQYIAFCAVSAVLMFGFGWRLDLYQIGEFGWTSVVAHVTMVPLSLATVRPEIGQAMLIPQSWSLGTELAFYLVFPFLRTREAIGWATAASLVVFALATQGAINHDPDAYAYRLLPGCLFIFLMGALIERGDRQLLFRAIFGLAAIVLGLTVARRLPLGLNRELILGVTVALVAVSTLTKLSSGKFDALLGDLSYGVYLSHFVVIAIVGHLGWLADHFILRCGLVLAGSVVAAAVGLVLVERPAANYRKSLRRAKITKLVASYGTGNPVTH
jgi:peptidoglycan/LPS O-acetylase OafA/YrhL